MEDRPAPIISCGCPTLFRACGEKGWELSRSKGGEVWSTLSLQVGLARLN
jgi:hypothetical protein